MIPPLSSFFSLKRIGLYSLSIFLSVFLGYESCQATDWDRDSLEQTLSNLILEPIEGIWQFPEDGATLGIVRASSSSYSIILLDSPRLDIPAGCIIGYAVVTPDPEKYDAHLQSSKLSNSKIKKSHSVLEVSKGHLKFKPYSTHSSISFRRWIPYFFRVTITKASTPDGLTGAQRVFPNNHENYKPCL